MRLFTKSDRVRPRLRDHRCRTTHQGRPDLGETGPDRPGPTLHLARCARDPRWCDAHHIEHSADGRRREPGNLRLLCRYHHTRTHEQDRGPSDAHVVCLHVPRIRPSQRTIQTRRDRLVPGLSGNDLDRRRTRSVLASRRSGPPSTISSTTATCRPWPWSAVPSPPRPRRSRSVLASSSPPCTTRFASLRTQPPSACSVEGGSRSAWVLAGARSSSTVSALGSTSGAGQWRRS